nr:ATP-binding protein [Streptomyces sp. V3I7]
MIPSAPLATVTAADRSGPGAVTGVVPGGVAVERRFRFELAAHPASPAQARRLTRARLAGWSVSAETRDSAALVVSELVTNAIVHTTSCRLVCELRRHEDSVRISVCDEGCAPGEPHPSPQQPEEEHGRGLLLVEALCEAWGAQEHGPGLLVWAELRNDLGWGARPKPGPSQGSSDQERTQPDHRLTEPDHGFAALEHRPAAPEHGLANLNHRLPAPEHGLTESDHGLAGSEPDHLFAEPHHRTEPEWP